MRKRSHRDPRAQAGRGRRGRKTGPCRPLACPNCAPGRKLRLVPDPAIIGETPTDTAPETSPAKPVTPLPAPEFGGRDGPDPTRYGDWEKNGRCIDF
ncbi:DUF1674 domain-containing protein [Luteimonas terricola]|uniref:DUF1674 domain-containing protein n=1 Tax=Luteimonas terricola TaxID=645597 RepID=UPI001FB6EBE0|nr:DUF1674 domain-containing protein [Luteimonas terricola]